MTLFIIRKFLPRNWLDHRGHNHLHIQAVLLRARYPVLSARGSLEVLLRGIRMTVYVIMREAGLHI